MKKIIIIILLILILFLNFINKKKENLVSRSNIDIYLKKCSIGDNNLYSNINILNKVKINDKEFADYILDYAYPVGSFYVQFPDLDKNMKIYSSNDPIAFPESQSPAKLFGGYWQEQWPTESIYFRTRGMLSNENRDEYGFQDYATKHLYGSNESFDHFLSEDVFSGVFNKNKTTEIIRLNCRPLRVDKPSKVDLNLKQQINISDVENRVKNRVIKIWKRVAIGPDDKYPPLPANGRDTVSDKNYYSGPYYGKTFTNYTVINAKSVDEAKNICNQNEECNFIGKKDDIWYSSNDLVMQDGTENTFVLKKKKATFTLKKDDVFQPYVDLTPVQQEEIWEYEDEYQSENNEEEYIEEEERPEGFYEVNEVQKWIVGKE